MGEETFLKNIILDWLKYNGYFFWLTNTQGNYNPRTKSYYKNPRLLNGVADILGVLPNGRFCSIETKIGKNKQSPAQIKFEKMVKKNNGIYLLTYDYDIFLADFKKIYQNNLPEKIKH